MLLEKSLGNLGEGIFGIAWMSSNQHIWYLYIRERKYISYLQVINESKLFPMTLSFPRMQEPSTIQRDSNNVILRKELKPNKRGGY